MSEMTEEREKEIRYLASLSELYKEVFDDLLKEIDRLRAEAKVDWIPVKRMKLENKTYWVVYTDNGKAHSGNLDWNTTYRIWENWQGDDFEEYFKVTHVAEFKYPKPPEAL